MHEVAVRIDIDRFPLGLRVNDARRDAKPCAGPLPKLLLPLSATVSEGRRLPGLAPERSGGRTSRAKPRGRVMLKSSQLLNETPADVRS